MGLAKGQEVYPMADPVAEAGERAADAAEAIVESAVASVEGDLAAAEARADAAEAINEALTESARRDILHDEIQDIAEEGETWRSEHEAVHQALNDRLNAMETRYLSLEERLTETASKLTVLTVSTPPNSEVPETETPEAPTVTVQEVEPGSVVVPVAQKAPVANRPRWT